MSGNGNFAGCTGYTWEYRTKHIGPGSTASYLMPGGTGNIYPSEYGNHHYDQYSGARGYTTNVYFRDYSINDVELNDTFESWRIKTNNEIIEKLNLLQVYGATAGDGMMMALGTGGTLAYAFSGNVLRTHSTFCSNVSVGGQLRVAGSLIGVDNIDTGITVGHNFNENLLILNTNESPAIGCDYAGLIIGGYATGPNPESIDNSDGADYYNSFVFDRPYFVHKEGKWRTKEGLWFEGRLNHQNIFTGLTGGAGPGSTGGDYPYGPYGYTGCSADINNLHDWNDVPVVGGVVRMYFGPTLDGYNYLEVDGRGDRVGVTGDPWTGTGGFNNQTAPNALVVGNTAGALVEFQSDGFVNIVKGANNIRVEKRNHGFVFGNVLRYSGTTQGYTYASAAGDYELHGDHIRAAEVIGVVSRVINNDTFDLTMSGEVVGTKAEWNTALIENHTEGLVPGNVYFLSQYGVGDRGKLQKEEPSLVGYVNKPVVLATGKTSGIVLPYRAQMNSSTGCTSGDGAGASGDELTSFVRAYDSGEQTFVEGSPVCIDTNMMSGIGLATNTEIAKAHVLGVVSYADSVNGYVRIVTAGTWTPSVGVFTEGTGVYYLGDGELTTLPSGNATVKILDAMSPTRVVVNIDTPSIHNFTDIIHGGRYRNRGSGLGKYLTILGPTGATGHTYDNVGVVNKNELLNPDFGIWQRGIGTTGAYGGTANTYFADRWLRLGQFATGATNPLTGNSGGSKRGFDYKLARGKFNKKETLIEGHPDYYAIIRGGVTYYGGSPHGATMNNEWYRVEQRIPDATSFAGEVMTISFYAKGDNPGNYACTGDCQVAFIQNLTGTTGDVPGGTSGVGVNANEIITPITDFRVNKTWTPYNFSFFVPELSSAAGASGASHEIVSGASADNFVSIAFYTQDTNRGITFNYDLWLSQVKLERGNMATPFNIIDPHEELKKCQKYYQNSYVYGVPVGADTMSTPTHPDTSGINFIVSNSFIHIYEFPERMRTVPNCSLWSPQGFANEAFNRDAGKSLRNVAGTKGFDGRQRQTRANSFNVKCSTNTPNAVEIKILGGAVQLDTITVHYEADAEFNNAFPTPVKSH